MNTINFDLIKNINLIESKSTSKENKNISKENRELDDVNSFEKYLNQSKNELNKENKLDNKVDNKSDNKIDNKSQKESIDDLNKVVEKIEDVLQKSSDELEEVDLSENISEIILLLLKCFSENENSDSNEVDSSNLQNVDSDINFTDLEGISNFITENLMLDNDSIDSSKVILQLSDIKTSIDEILNNIDLSELESKVSLDDTLINAINELLTEVVNKDVISKEDFGDNENLDIAEIIDYLKSNFAKEEKVDSNLDIKAFRDLSNLNNVNKEDTFNNSESKNSDSNTNFNNNDKSLETLKEEDFLSKLLNEDTVDANFNNYYDRIFNNKLQNNVEVIAAPVNINKETMNADIIKNIKYMIVDSIEELSVKIYPKELGEVTIKILSEEGIMKAEIKATSKETYNLINSNLNEIKKSLESQNIKIQEVNIGIYNEDTTFFSGKEGQNHKERSFNENINSSYIYEEEEVIEEINLDNNVNYLA